MMNLLILFVLSKKELTMYKICMYISDYFAAFTKPGFGAIKPALIKLEQNGFINSRKTLSEGGKQSCYYTITSSGLEELKKLILTPISKNPVQFFATANLRISCASFLERKEISALLFDIKTLALNHKYLAEKTLNDEYTPNTFYGRVVLDNAIVQYDNFINFIESLEKENGKN